MSPASSGSPPNQLIMIILIAEPDSRVKGGQQPLHLLVNILFIPFIITENFNSYPVGLLIATRPKMANAFTTQPPGHPTVQYLKSC